MSPSQNGEVKVAIVLKSSLHTFSGLPGILSSALSRSSFLCSKSNRGPRRRDCTSAEEREQVPSSPILRVRAALPYRGCSERPRTQQWLIRSGSLDARSLARAQDTYSVIVRRS